MKKLDVPQSCLLINMINNNNGDNNNNVSDKNNSNIDHNNSDAENNAQN